MRQFPLALFTPVRLLPFLLGILKCCFAGGKIPGVEVSVPPSHTALSGDLHVQIISSSFPPLLLQLARLEGDTTQTLTTFPILPEAKALSLNKTVVKIQCGYFSKGGQYYVLIKRRNAFTTTLPSNANTTVESVTEDNFNDDSVITRSLDVRWPMPHLSLTPEHIQTYPESPVMAILEFPEVVCPPVSDSPASAIPEFWLELHYCGHSLLTCDSYYEANSMVSPNKTNVQVLYSEQVRGFPGKRVLTLRCELFGLAGHYALVLRPTSPSMPIPHTNAYLKADWSDQFVFNVHAHSIFPCDVHSGGITVLFQYPSCILAAGDRVRLFARLRANVASIASPTTLEYVAEQRIKRGQHSLKFECELFSELYVEYCFVYVSQAITGAVADVRMDCVPTLPVSEAESGGWGPWSAWTPCTSTCIGGTRSRYRFCDNPPPRYGARFCEGPAVETEKCGTKIGTGLECFYGNSVGSEIAAEMPEIQAEVGPYCRCGCVVHLGHAKPRRLLATSSQSCPGRTFWLIQADEEYFVQFTVEQFRLPCGTQWLKVRDGRSLSSALLEDLSGTSESSTPAVVNSTGPYLLLEFYTDDASSGKFCGGGFLAHALQIRHDKNVTGVPIAQGVGLLPSTVLKLTAVHIAAIFFLSGLLIATALLGAQYMFRYRKYHVARAEDLDSLADPTASCVSLPLRLRASSNATLLSEVISLTRLRSGKPRNKHSRLRESMDCEGSDEVEVALAKEEDTLSGSSTMTLTQQETATTGIPHTTSELETATVTYSLPTSPVSNDDRTLRRSSTISESEKDKSTEKNEQRPRGFLGRRLSVASTASTATLTKVREEEQKRSKSDPGYYSPAASVISTATIRSTNPKESKEKRNREKLLAGPAGSEFSLSGPEVDLEIDYYDYNVSNAGAAPGSYLGMDPAFLVWIPPLDESGEILPDDRQLYDELKPKEFVDPGSNKESPEEEMLLPKNAIVLNEVTPKCSPLQKHKKIHPLIDPNTLSSESLILQLEKASMKIPGFNKNENDNQKVVSIQLHEFASKKKPMQSPVKVHRHKEKETKVEKSPVDSNILDEIKFADDEDEMEGECNVEVHNVTVPS